MLHHLLLEELFIKNRTATNPVPALCKAKLMVGQLPCLETFSLTERKRKWLVDDLKIIVYDFTSTSDTIKTKQLLFPSCLEKTGTILSVVVDCFSIIQLHKRN